ncbi:DUF1624 domain-containing protein [Parvularcula marina]|uniref:DUF1624 domain-containing protein n=1 Tax=Parvularcula marina TaxID=2292771 RepID=A0A371RIR0_9PROT|nr:heparan-alpha-glucosaminide N-acetyltransferase domain-containing protein [Parvularcula marina]RFB05330.1 DUF1624 domain-containing protein [Parvularcula marina]
MNSPHLDRVERPRIRSVDLLRGLIIIIMALDHVRDYWSIASFDPLDASQTTFAYGFTRWITHYCAPVFILLAGTSAFLYAHARQASKAHLARFLVTRGLWLMFIEITVVSFSWQFAYQAVFLQVIWVIGLSMIVLAGLIFLPRRVVGLIGLALIFLHNLFDGIAPGDGFSGALWSILHVPSFSPVGESSAIPGIFLVYPLIPWAGVMALGYAAAPILLKPAAERDRILYLTGAAAIALFLVLRGFNLYGDPGAWAVQDSFAMSVVSFVNVLKYPPSLQFLLMTLGPALLLIPLLEKWSGAWADRVSVFGKVPFFFYVIHIPFVHATAWLWQIIQYGDIMEMFFDPSTWPEEYAPNLLRAYIAWASTIFILYWPCKWFAGLKKRRKDWWLSYL